MSAGAGYVYLNPEHKVGLAAWFRNFFQVYKTFTERDRATVTSPYVEYWIFCTFKTAQVASFFGGIFVRSWFTSRYLKKIKPEEITKNTDKIAKQLSRQIQGRILIGALLATPLVTASSIFINDYTPEKLAERCYQIRCDSEILAYDRYTLFLGFLGWYWKRFQGAVDGINIALLYTIIHIKVARQYLNPVDLDPLHIKGIEELPTVEDGDLESSHFYRFIRRKMEEKGISFRSRSKDISEKEEK